MSGKAGFGDKVAGRIHARPIDHDRGVFLGNCKAVGKRPKDDRILWIDEGPNIIPNEGLSAFLTCTLQAAPQALNAAPGEQPAQLWCGLGTGGMLPTATSTYASPGFTEFDQYTLTDGGAETDRPLYNNGTYANNPPNETGTGANASAILSPTDATAPQAASVFFIIGTGDQVIGGAFICTEPDTDGFTTAGRTLIAARPFSGGDRTLQPGDTLEITYTFTGTST